MQTLEQQAAPAAAASASAAKTEADSAAAAPEAKTDTVKAEETTAEEVKAEIKAEIKAGAPTDSKSDKSDPAASRLPTHVSPRDAAAVAWAFAMARQHDPRLQRLLLRVCRGRARMLGPSELADLLYAAVWSGLPLSSPLVTGALQDATESLSTRGLSSLSPQQISRLTWTLSAWGVPAYAARPFLPPLVVSPSPSHRPWRHVAGMRSCMRRRCPPSRRASPI